MTNVIDAAYNIYKEGGKEMFNKEGSKGEEGKDKGGEWKNAAQEMLNKGREQLNKGKEQLEKDAAKEKKVFKGKNVEGKKAK